MTQETQEIAWSISECNRVQRQGRKGDSETRKAGRLRNEESRKTQGPNNSGRAGEFLIHLRFSEFFPKNWTMINAQTLRLQACFRRNCSGMEEWGLELLGTVSIKAGWCVLTSVNPGTWGKSARPSSGKQAHPGLRPDPPHPRSFWNETHSIYND